MLSFEQIKELIEMVAKHRLQGLEVERSGFKLSISGQEARAAAPLAAAAPAVDVVAAAPASAGPATAVPPVAPAPPAAAAGHGEAAADAHLVRSPIVGTFYASPSPDAEPFVRVGDHVRAGQVLCIVEAMKLMNEIESDVAGTMVQVLVKNAQPVEYNEPLFAIKPA
jgi:acetyl-CoA carboxylase biotin carboxyl carrier protein